MPSSPPLPFQPDLLRGFGQNAPQAPAQPRQSLFNWRTPTLPAATPWSPPPAAGGSMGTTPPSSGLTGGAQSGATFSGIQNTGGAGNSTSGWSSPLPPLQGGIYPVPVHSMSARPDAIQQTTVDGRQVWQFRLNAGDVTQWDTGNIGPGGKPNQRAEISYTQAPSSQKANSPYNVTSNTGPRTYAASFKLGTDFPTDQRWAMLMNFHAADNNVGSPGYGGMSIHGNYLDFAVPGDDSNKFIHVPFQKDRWYDMRQEINWTDKPDGYVRVYDGDKLLGQYNGPTIQPGTYRYIKQGYYRDGSVNQTGTVYQTPMKIY